jgi:hypothetical protein
MPRRSSLILRNRCHAGKSGVEAGSIFRELTDRRQKVGFEWRSHRVTEQPRVIAAGIVGHVIIRVMLIIIELVFSLFVEVRVGVVRGRARLKPLGGVFRGAFACVRRGLRALVVRHGSGCGSVALPGRCRDCT